MPPTNERSISPSSRPGLHPHSATIESISSQEDATASFASGSKSRPSTERSVSNASTVTPHALSRFNRRLSYFNALERTCLSATAEYIQIQRDSAFSKPPLTGPFPALRRSAVSFPVLASMPHPATCSARLSAFHAVHPPLGTSLGLQLHAIADLHWQRASQLNDPAAAYEAACRMRNVYVWGHEIVRAARGELGFDDEDMLMLVTIAARDLVGWLLHERAMAEVDRLWLEWREERDGLGGQRGEFGSVDERWREREDHHDHRQRERHQSQEQEQEGLFYQRHGEERT